MAASTYSTQNNWMRACLCVRVCMFGRFFFFFNMFFITFFSLSKRMKNELKWKPIRLHVMTICSVQRWLLLLALVLFLFWKGRGPRPLLIIEQFTFLSFVLLWLLCVSLLYCVVWSIGRGKRWQFGGGHAINWWNYLLHFDLIENDTASGRGRKIERKRDRARKYHIICQQQHSEAANTNSNVTKDVQLLSIRTGFFSFRSFVSWKDEKNNIVK